MADSKITALTSISTSTDPANDPLVIVDVSDTSMAASGTAKKVTLNQLLGASGTATLASATITGDLTVDTSTLKVDSANNRVGIVNASPSFPLDVIGDVALTGNENYVYLFSNYSIGNNSRVRFRAVGAGGGSGYGGDFRISTRASNNTWNTDVLTIDSSANCIWTDGAGGTRMTLNSTGLGVGVVPSAARLEVGGQDGTQFYIRSTGTTPSKIRGFTNAAEAGVIGFLNGGGIYFDISGERMRIDSSGNVGIGVTPSATMKLDVQGQSIRLNSGSATGFALLRLGGTASDSFFGFAGNANDIVTGTSAGDTVIGSNKAGANLRFISGNGSLNATLDASGNLLVGTTSALSAVSGSSQIALGGAGLQTTSQAISAATATTICRSGSGGMAVVGGYNGTGQYSAIIIFSYGAGGGVTVVSSQNNTGSTITYALSGVNVQITSSLALTNLTTTCIRTA